MKKVWSERRWWQSFVAMWGSLGALFGGFALFGYSAVTIGNDPTRGVFLLHMFLLVVSIIPMTCGLVVCAKGNVGRMATYGPAFAVVEKGKGTQGIIGYGYDEVYLKPYPFPTRYEIVEYPGTLQFSCPFQPITKNPKMVPLSIHLSTVYEPSDAVGARFIFESAVQKLARQNFLRRSFEAIQHRIPQELAERVNPYDPDSLCELEAFLKKELDVFNWGHTLGKVSLSIRQS